MFGNRLIVDLFILALFAIAVYSFIILPRQLNFRRTQKYVREGLDPGTEVVTYGGMIGTVTRVEADQGIVYMEIAPDVEIRVLSASIAQKYDPTRIAAEAQKGAPRRSKE